MCNACAHLTNAVEITRRKLGDAMDLHPEGLNEWRWARYENALAAEAGHYRTRHADR